MLSRDEVTEISPCQLRIEGMGLKTKWALLLPPWQFEFYFLVNVNVRAYSSDL